MEEIPELDECSWRSFEESREFPGLLLRTGDRS